MDRNRFIPGTTASAVNYYAYLLDRNTKQHELIQLNASSSSNILRSFNSELKWKVCALCHYHHTFVQINSLSRSVQVGLVFPNHQTPLAYTGEGREYLF